MSAHLGAQSETGVSPDPLEVASSEHLQETSPLNQSIVDN